MSFETQFTGIDGDCPPRRLSLKTIVFENRLQANKASQER